jgi:hypothetical protein
MPRKTLNPRAVTSKTTARRIVDRIAKKHRMGYQIQDENIHAAVREAFVAGRAEGRGSMQWRKRLRGEVLPQRTRRDTEE